MKVINSLWCLINIGLRKHLARRSNIILTYLKILILFMSINIALIKIAISYQYPYSIVFKCPFALNRTIIMF